MQKLKPIYFKGVVMCFIFMVSIALFVAFQDGPVESETEITGATYYEQLVRADQLLASQDFDGAVKIYERLSKSDDKNGRLFEKIASCQKGLGNLEEANEATLQMIRLGHGNLAFSYYAIAQNHALNGEISNALDWYEKALDAGFKTRRPLQQGPTFKALRNHPRFAELAGLLPKKKFSREQGWQYDLDFFTREVARLSADPERYGVSKQFLDDVKSLSQRVPDLSNEHIALEIQKLATSLNNGHTNVYPMPTKHVRFTMLPIQLYLFSDGMFVVGGKGKAANLVGSKVLSIGSKDPVTLMQDVKSIIHRDNDAGLPWLGPQFLAMPEVLEYLAAIESTDEVPFKFEDRQGNISTVNIKSGPMSRPAKLGPAAKGPAPLYLQDQQNNYWLRKLPNLDAVYVQFNQVRDKKGGESIQEFSETLRQTIADTKPKVMVVDLRHNNGGNAFLYQPLVPPLVFFEMLDKNNRLFVITGRNTFSAAQNFLNSLEIVTNPIIVGEPSSSRPNSVSAETEVVLPWSGLRMSIAYLYFQDSKPTDRRPWIPPHVPVKLSSTEYFSNCDPAMDAIEKIVRDSSD